MQSAPDFSLVMNRYRSSVGAAVQAGTLPRGFGIEVRCTPAGMFTALNVEVIRCEVLVVDPAHAASPMPVLNTAGEYLRKVLLKLANENAGIVGVVKYRRDLLAQQASTVRTLDASALAAMAWNPPANDSAPDEPPPPASAASDEAMVSGYALLADRLLERITAGAAMSSAELFKLADEAFGGTMGAGAYVAKDAYEASELAMNRHIRANSAVWTLDVDADSAVRIASEIETAAALLPTQTRRDGEMLALQQFSTPPAYAYALAWAAGMTAGDVVFEPSAGNGGLAVHASNAGAKVHVNEIANRRKLVLRALGYEPTGENAEQVHNIFAGKLTPTVVLMNPPFSRSIRTGDKKDLSVAGEHVEAALKLLPDGGRLVCITGKNTGAASNRGSWITRIRSKYAVRANLLVGGALYKAHGTSIETRVVVIDKVPANNTAPVIGQADTLEQLIRLLAPVRRTSKVDDDGDGADSRFAAYRPARLDTAKLGLPTPAPHPGKLVESWAMSAVTPPEIWYVPSFPEDVIAEGKISAAQLEVVCYAGQAHAQWLEAHTDGVPWRRAYYIGDGTGVGKGREIAAVILDNWHKGIQRHVWLTKDSTKLLKAAKRDFKALGGDPALVFPLRATPAGEPVKAPHGVMLVSFGELRSNRPGKSRVQQIVDWLGSDFEGVLAMDESHKMGNAMDEKGERGRTKASQTALAGIDIQRLLPKARVVYISATAASEVRNFCFADRLGIYGPGTPFPTKEAFVSRIEAGGVASMEIVARDLKAMGLFSARSLSYADVKFERLVHELAPAQLETYDTLADAWQVVLSNLDAAMDSAGSKSDAGARSAALSAFWGSNQRFWNQVLTSMQLPTAVREMERDIAAGHAVVVQLVNTLEAQQERALSKEGAMEALDDLDLTPRDILMQYLEASFPVHAYEEYTDEEGNTRTRPVIDEAGNRVVCAEAVKMRDDMLARVGCLKVPHGPLEAIIDHFGVETVAEITGRSRRVVTLADPETGLPTRQIQSRSEGARLADMEAFANDNKRILIFSNAANTGVDFHASNQIPNRRLRRHYVLQAGWNAKECTQALGRTHRSDQAHAPEYILVTTNLRGQLRFITSIARRLGALGALTKGQRDTGSQGLMSERDNLEGEYGTAAINQIILELHIGGTIAGLTMAEFERKLGLRLTDREGNLTRNSFPPVRQFLNRLLALKVADQNALFDEFQDRLDEHVQAAIDAGIYNQGVEEYRADRIEVVSPPRTVYVEPSSKAETYYVHLRAWHRRTPRSFHAVADGRMGGKRREVTGFVREIATGAVFAVATARARTDESGNVIAQVRLIGPYSERFEEARNLSSAKAFAILSSSEAESLWLEQARATKELQGYDLNLICGVLLPVWDRLDAGGRVFRVIDETGAQYLGRLIHPGRVRSTLAKLGADLNTAWTPEEAIDAVLTDVRLDLVNGWKLKRARVNGEYRIEVVGFQPSDIKRLADLGCRREIVQYATRLFVPTADASVMTALLRVAPVAEDDADAAEAA